MNRHILGPIVAVAALWPAAAGAQTTVIETTGAAPPDEVITYVERERVPSVRVQEDVRVGAILPGAVEVHTIPRHNAYNYAIVNDRRVIVEPRTRKIIRVIE